MPRQKPVRWPGGARIAILPQLIFEGWIGDHAETRTVPEVPVEDMKTGAIDFAGRAWASYGSEVGAGRLIDLFERYGLPGTGIFSGVAIERYPEIGRRWVAAGNEIAAHSYAQDIRIYPLSLDDERANIRRCVEAFEGITGYRPVGWNSPAGQCTPDTTRLLLEEGFYYSYDYKDDDRPYSAAMVGGRTMVAVPKLFDVNDVVSYSFAAHPPSYFVEAFCRAFDQLYKEGGKMLSLSAHAAMYGRPFGLSAVEECIRYARSFPDVWYATGRAVADCWLEQAGDA